jgi:hypothetical protein
MPRLPPAVASRFDNAAYDRDMRVVFATCSAVPNGWPDDHPAAELLQADRRPWDDANVDWASYDRVVVRSVYDYASRVDDFLEWCDRVGAQRLRNSPALLAFNADKNYLAQLRSPTVPTVYVRPTEPPPRLTGEVVVKPNISAAARDTGRFSPETHTLAAELISRIQASGRVALVQQYLPSVDERGERSFVFFGGQLSHVLHKAPVLRPDEVAPIAEEGLGRELQVAQAMLDPGLVAPGEADPDEHALAHEVHTEISNRFGTPLLLRIDLVRDLIGAPLVMEIEAIEPLLYLSTKPGATEAFAAAVRAS